MCKEGGVGGRGDTAHAKGLDQLFMIPGVQDDSCPPVAQLVVQAQNQRFMICGW